MTRETFPTLNQAIIRKKKVATMWKRRIGWLILVLGLSACTPQMPDIPLLDKKVEIPLLRMDELAAKSLPQSRKASYGTVTLLGIGTQPGNGEKELAIIARFRLVSFEIPEGIDGEIRYVGSLRYDPKTRQVYPAQLKAVAMTFGNSSLQEYVSDAARRGLPATVASMLRNLPLYRLPDSSSSRAIRSFSVQENSVRIDFD